MADAYQWGPEQVLALSLRQLKVYTTSREELLGKEYRHEGAARAEVRRIQELEQHVVANLIAGRPAQFGV